MRDPWGDPFDDLQMVDFPNTFLNWLEGKWSLSPHSKMFIFHPEHADVIDWCPVFIKIPFFVDRYCFYRLMSCFFSRFFVDYIFPWTKPGYNLLFHTSSHACTERQVRLVAPKGSFSADGGHADPCFFSCFHVVLPGKMEISCTVHIIYCMYIYSTYYIYICMYVIHLTNVTDHLM